VSTALKLTVPLAVYCAALMQAKLEPKWSPQQIAAWLRVSIPTRPPAPVLAEGQRLTVPPVALRLTHRPGRGPTEQRHRGVIQSTPTCRRRQARGEVVFWPRKGAGAGCQG
jgi:hypothetical protein